MRQFVTADDILAELLMVRTQFKGTLLILEGPTDCLFFDGLIEATQCRTIPGYGKERVIGVIEQVDKRQLQGILGIVDADFWHMDEVNSSSPNLLVTDLHDLEMMLIRSRAFERVIAQYGSAKKIAAYMARTSVRDLPSALSLIVLPSGLLQWMNQREGLALKFEGVDIDQHVDRASLTLDLPKFISNVVQNTGKTGLRAEDLMHRLRPELNKRHRLSQMCSGHDVIRIVAVGLRRRLGSCTFHIASYSNIEAMLRMAYDSSDFQQTSLYRAIKDWEARNIPFIVLAI